jgi:predicted anti-sigma-YlaC factor YlaD
MNCKSVESKLSAYLDGELTGQEMFCLREHLSRCQPCRDEAASLKMLKRMIGSIECPKPRPDLESRLCAAVMREREPRVTTSAFRSVLVFAGVAGLTMLITMQFLGTWSHTQTAVVRPTSTGEKPGIDFEVRSDAMASSMSDPISGAPVWSAADSR